MTIGRPPLPESKKRKRIQIYVAPETEQAIKSGIGMRELGRRLDKEYSK